MKATRRTVLKWMSAAGSALLVRPPTLLPGAIVEGAAIAAPPHINLLTGADGIIGAAQFYYGAIETKEPLLIVIGIGHRLSWLDTAPEVAHPPLSRLMHDPAYIQQIIDYALHPQHIWQDNNGESHASRCNWALDEGLKGNPQKARARIEWILSQPELADMEKPDWKDHLIRSLRQTFSDHLHLFGNLDWREAFEEQFSRDVPTFCRYFGDLVEPEVFDLWKKLAKQFAFDRHREKLEYESEQYIQHTPKHGRVDDFFYNIRPVEAPVDSGDDTYAYEISLPWHDLKKQEALLQIIKESLTRDKYPSEIIRGEISFDEKQNKNILTLCLTRDAAGPLDELCVRARAKQMAEEQPTPPAPIQTQTDQKDRLVLD